jgi:hypothetical protein
VTGAPWCRWSERRAAVRAAPDLTGLDDAEYLRHAGDDGTDASQPRRPRLHVRLLGPALEPMLDARSWVIEGGRRVRDLRVERVRAIADPEGDAVLELELDREGDASTYAVRVVRDRGADLRPPEGVDPRYDRAEVLFKLDCAAELDCKPPAPACPGEGGDGPALDYLAKDYASFRQLLLDRISLVLPAWRERHVPDVGIMLIELFAYAGDQLAYRQDVIATEAYLDTARLRTSIRRHARLVDYAMHEGANARAWVTVCVGDDVVWRAGDVAFYTRVPEWSPEVTAEQAAAAPTGHEVFLPIAEPDDALWMWKELGRIRFYTWGGEECCLPRGATRATLQLPPGSQAALAPGDVLILEEVLGPETGLPEHADPAHRHAVRLIRVEPTRDPLAEPEPGAEAPPALHEIEWMAEDALPFPLCLSALDPAAGCAPIHDVSVARGNVILVDHGRRVEEDLGAVETEAPAPVCEAPHRPALAEPRPRRFRPELARRPLTFRAPPPEWTAVDALGHATEVPPPASVMLRQDPRAALPAIELDSAPVAGAAVPPRTWTPRRDLLDSSGDDAHFVVEMDHAGGAHLRFGDGVNGLAPEPGATFRARYRIGNGPAGNVPAEAIAHVSVTGGAGAAVSVRNPLPAAGGFAPEPVDEVRLLAPASLHHRRERAVIAADYAELALRDHAALQRAAAVLRWTGSWYEVLVGLDPAGAGETSPELRATVERDLERYRRIGHDLRVEGAHYVPVLLELEVCARPEYLRGDVHRAVLDALVGEGGFFEVDHFTFGQPLVLSALVAAVQAVPGVLAVAVRRMERLYEGDQGELSRGELEVGPLEVVQLEDDPALPEHGWIELHVGGGR